MSLRSFFLATIALCQTAGIAHANGELLPDGKSGRSAPAYVLDHTVTRIDGEKEDLSKYEGKVLLIVNVASRCGLTPQYEGLESLFQQRSERGLVILGFPANNFGGQEPGSNDQIAEFCMSQYGVTFPLFEKISVRGEDQHPLYADLCRQPKPIGEEPSWNFTKYLVDRHGKVVARFDPRTKPDDPDLLKEIDRLLDEQIGD